MGFYHIVLTIAIIVFIIVLAVFGLSMARGTSTITYPPEVSCCPDYWSMTSTGQNGSWTCKPNSAIGNVGTWANGNKVFGTDTSSLSAAKIWADGAGIYWDGISGLDMSGNTVLNPPRCWCTSCGTGGDSTGNSPPVPPSATGPDGRCIIPAVQLTTTLGGGNFDTSFANLVNCATAPGGSGGYPPKSGCSIWQGIKSDAKRLEHDIFH